MMVTVKVMASDCWLNVSPRSTEGQGDKCRKEERKKGRKEAVEEKEGGQRGPITRYSASMAALSY